MAIDKYQSGTVIAAAVLAMIMLLMQLAGPESVNWLRLDRAQVYEGQWWRIFSAHLVHASWSHALLNAVAFVLVVAIFPLIKMKKWLLLLFSSSLVVSAGLLLATTVDWYVGFSGVLHGLFAGAAIFELEKNKKFALVLIMVICCKLAYEGIAGALPGSAAITGVQVITEAHLWGALGGSIAALASLAAAQRVSSI